MTMITMTMTTPVKGPAALPMQYADSMMAFVVTLFVCPAVVCDTQLNDNTIVTTGGLSH